MALSGITKVGGNSLEDSLNLTGSTSANQINVTGVVTATGGIDGIGIHSSGIAIHSGVITTLNFIGTGNTFAVHNNQVDISISGGSGGGIQLYDNVIDKDTQISLPYKTAVMQVDRDLTVDIENGVTISIDDGCYFNIADA
jgi:hypothetical protein